jgi:hypothetical protein
MFSLSNSYCKKSMSITSKVPYSFKKDETVDFPQAMPPVKPTI